MKTRFAIAVAVSSFVFALGAHSQPTTQTVVSSSDTTAPSVAPVAAPSPAATPNQLVYAARLPSVAELTNAATAQGLSIDRIEQTSAQITVVYRYGNGQTNVVAYLLLPAAGAATSPIPTPSAPPAVVYQPAPTVVYQPAPRVVYYDGYGYGPAYYPYYWYPPVSFSVGLGFNFHDGYHGGYGGGFHGGGHGGYHH